MKKQKNLKQHIGLLLAAGLLFAGTTVSAAENEPEQPKCMTTEQVEELNLCNTLDEQEPLTVEEATTSGWPVFPTSPHTSGARVEPTFTPI